MSANGHTHSHEFLLTDAQVRVDAGITSSSSQVLVFSIGNMEVSLWVAVLLSQAKVDYVDLITTLADSHQEVVWFDVAMDKGFGVDVFNTRDELVGKEEDCL